MPQEVSPETRLGHGAAGAWRLFWTWNECLDAERVLAALIEAGADPNVRDNTGATALHRAASSSQEPGTVGKLLEAGSSPGARDDDRRIPWDLLQRNGVPKPKRRRTAVWRQ